MLRKKQNIIAIGAAITMVFLILDSKTALYGASQGVNLCFKTVIPSLLPLFFLSGMVRVNSRNIKIPILNKLLDIPSGSECIWLISLIGGYPIGAKCLDDSWTSGSISKEDASRMLGFCNNVGPAFIFGILGPMFHNKFVPFTLWIVQILSSLLTGLLLPVHKNCFINVEKKTNNNETISEILHQSLRAIGTVCGWVIIFRVFLTLLERWILWIFPREMQIIIAGFFEITNGCILLSDIGDQFFRFIYASMFLCFGGICVLLQTLSVARHLASQMYIRGKIIQSLITLPLSYFGGYLLFPGNRNPTLSIIVFILIFSVVFYKNRFVKNNTGKKYVVHI